MTLAEGFRIHPAAVIPHFDHQPVLRQVFQQVYFDGRGAGLYAVLGEIEDVQRQVLHRSPSTENRPAVPPLERAPQFGERRLRR